MVRAEGIGKSSSLFGTFKRRTGEYLSLCTAPASGDISLHQHAHAPCGLWPGGLVDVPLGQKLDGASSFYIV